MKAAPPAASPASKKAVDALVRRVSVPRVAGERALDQPGAFLDLAGLDVGPAEIAEKPPIVTPMRRQFFEQRQLRLVMVAPPAETQKTKHPESQGEGERVSRIF